MRLLVVEDEPRLLANLAKALRESGYAVDTAPDGREGVHLALNCPYDAIVLDVMLPHIDGWGVLGRVREVKQTPVLMLTARDSLEDRVKGLDGGADDYLAKPFDMPELLARLRALIRRAAGSVQANLTAAGVVIDPRSKTVSKDGREVMLTGREYSIFEYMAINKGRVVSGAELHEHIFDENEDTLSNLVAVHIFSLRKKLGQEVIQTRRGLGYVIEA